MTTPVRSALLIAATLVGLSACAPATSTDEAPLPSETTWSSVIHGMPIDYYIVDELTLASGEPLNVGGVAKGAVVDGRCNIQILQQTLDTYRRDQLVELTADLVATPCLSEVVLDNDTNGFESPSHFADAWTTLYIERCGSSLRGLGWPMDELSCEPPEPQQASPT